MNHEQKMEIAQSAVRKMIEDGVGMDFINNADMRSDLADAYVADYFKQQRRMNEMYLTLDDTRRNAQMVMLNKLRETLDTTA